MVCLSSNEVWNLNENELLGLLNSEKLIPLPKRIHFYAPGFAYYKTSIFCSPTRDFPTISVTGNTCSLNCKHCGGKVLETMQSANTPEKLFDLCQKLKQEGARGCLISGGCLPDGSVPLQKFLTSISKIKNELGLTLFVHTGIIDERTAIQLKDALVDAVLIDIIGSDHTIHEAYNLKTTVNDYENSLKALHRSGLDFIPHIVTGLDHGKLKGEFNALKMISPYNPSAIVIISFMPIPGTEMARTIPPTSSEISRVIATARTMFPQVPLVLGCMRPKGKHRNETDVLAIKAGVNGIAFPSEEAIKYSKTLGYEIEFSSFCCAQIYKDMVNK